VAIWKPRGLAPWVLGAADLEHADGSGGAGSGRPALEIAGNLDVTQESREKILPAFASVSAQG
jgi:hypothetical protein